MPTKKELMQMKEAILKNYLDTLDENHLKKSLDKLTKDCFRYYLNDDEKSYNECLSTIKDLIGYFSGDFPNIFDYVNYLFLKNMNAILNTILKKDFDLKILFHSELHINPDELAELIYTDKYYNFNQKVLLSPALMKKDIAMFQAMLDYKSNDLGDNDE